MKKNGIIPPHFIYFLEKEGVTLSDYRSGNLSMKDSYDRVTISLPYSIKSIEIQIIFDYLDYSAPPDFLIIPTDEPFYIDYNTIFSNWNFKDSSSLYSSLQRLRSLYSKEQERILYEQLDNNDFTDQMRKIVSVLKSRVSKYKHQDPNHTVDILHNYQKDNMYYIVVSFPLDITIRNRNAKRYPIINMMIPVNFDSFYLTLNIPNYISGIDLKQEEYNLHDFEELINRTEKQIQNHFKAMKLRENIIGQLICANLGFPMEIDCFNFNNCSLYLHYDRSHMDLNANNSVKGAMSSNMVTNVMKGEGLITGNNYILQFLFKNGNKIEFQIIDCDKLTILSKENYDYGESEKDMTRLLQNVLQNLITYLKNKK
jgi:hypothetical protein